MNQRDGGVVALMLLVRSGGVIALMLALLMGCGAEDRTVACPELAPGTPVVGAGTPDPAATPGAWAEPRDAAHLRELWRAGGLAEDQHLALPVGAVTGPTGITAIPDFQLAEVAAVGPDGSWMGPVLARGQGPGELTRPVLAAWDSDAILHIVDLEGGKVERWNPSDGSAEGRRVAVQLLAPMYQRGELGWVGLLPGRALAALDEELRGGGTEPGTIVRAFVIQALDGGPVDTVVAFEAPRAGRGFMPVPGWPRGAQAVAPDGRLAWADTAGAFAVVVLGPELEPLFVICRDEPPLPLSEADFTGDMDPSEIEAYRLESTVELYRDAPTPPSPATIGRLVFDADGRLWVQRERLRPFSMDLHWGTPGAEHLVFDRDGGFLGRVRLPPGAHLQSALGDTLITFQPGELDEIWVVAYRIER